jgi:hypothetical protein
MTMTGTDKTMMTDRELDTLLAGATSPQLPEGAVARLMARTAAAPDAPVSNIIPLRRAEAPRSRMAWLAGLPLAASLAASLAIGIYLGAAGSATALNPISVLTSTSTATGDNDTGSGIDDALDFNEDSLT